jgi:hypothetical protein
VRWPCSGRRISRRTAGTPPTPLRANFEHSFASGYNLRVEELRLFTGADAVERPLLACAFGGRSEAIWAVNPAAGEVPHANSGARRLSCL